MILDQAEDLKVLAAQAVSSGEESDVDAALAAVHRELEIAEQLVIDFGIGRATWRERLSVERRALLAARAAALAGEIAPLHGRNDEELAAFGLRTDTQSRGRLPAVKRAALALRDALVEGQSELLTLWVERLWPSSEAARLQVLAHMPATSAAANDVIQARERLSEPLGRAGTRLTDSDLGRLVDIASRAEQRALTLHEQDVPDEVVEFWQAAEGEDGVSLEQLTPGAFQWLIDHGAAGRFIVTARV